jgi:tetratricopeptide (TPR) repeat protein
MDRTFFAACALVGAPLVLGAGCGSRSSDPPAASAPKVLAELQQASPGPWRRVASEPVEVAALEDPAERTYAPPGVLGPADIDDRQTRLRKPAAPTLLQPGDKAHDEASPAEVDPPGLRPEPVQPAQAAPERAHVPATGVSPPAQPTSSSGLSPRRLPSTMQPADDDWDVARNNSEIAAAVKHAGRRVRHGFELAERNAIFLARREFIASLELLAQANDARHDSPFYSESLVAGLTALAESRDFTRQRPLGKPLDVARIASGHRTSVIRESAQGARSASAAVRLYQDYALERLAAAAAGEPCGSAALYGLAKVALSDVDGSLGQHLIGAAQAKVLFRAALVADAGNHRAANELGVILAHNGDLPGARDLLQRSAELKPHPTTYRNLAAVENKLGEHSAAQAALARASELERSGIGRRGPAVTWVDPATFASTKPAGDSLLPPLVERTGPAPPEVPATEAAEARPAATTARGGATTWLPFHTRR